MCIVSPRTHSTDSQLHTALGPTLNGPLHPEPSIQVPGTLVPVPTVSMTKAPSARKGEEANERVSVAQQEAAAAAAADVQVRYVGQGPADVV